MNLIQAQEQWDNRTAPKIHEAFSQIWDQEELRVSRDRVSINPPALDKDAAKESQVAFGLHFDTGFAQQKVAEAKKLRPIPKGVQGVLCKCSRSPCVFFPEEVPTKRLHRPR